MLSLAWQRAAKTCPESFGRVRFIRENIQDWSTQQSYDLLVTHFFLDCWPPDKMKAIIHKLAAAAAPGATWLIADFSLPPAGTLARLHSKLWLRAMYWFFRAVAGITANELVDPTPYLHANGFVLKACQLSPDGMVKSELWQRASPFIN
jgi:hypothetical protein